MNRNVVIPMLPQVKAFHAATSANASQPIAKYVA